MEGELQMKKVFSVLAAAAMLCCLFGCGTSDGGSDSGTFKIGVNTEMTGAVASYGTSELHGYQLAADEFNAAGGLNGQKVEFVELDNKSDAAESTSVATRLATSEGVSLILGPATTGDVQAELQVCEDNKIPMITPSATGDNVLKQSDGTPFNFAYRVCYKDSYQGSVLATFVKSDLNMSKAVILFDNGEDYCVGVRDAFKAAFIAAGGEVVDEQNYTNTVTDFSSVITKIKGEIDADTVIMISGYYGTAGLIIKQAREQGVDNIIVGPDGFESAQLAEISGAANCSNVYYSTHYSSLDTTTADFISAYKAKFGTEPDAFAALAYDAANLAFDAIKRAGSTDPEKINEALAATAEFTGITGTIAIDASHDAVKSCVIVKLDNGVQVSAQKAG